MRRDGFAPIGDYGLIGDGQSAALVAADGSVDWWAVPSMDAPPVFAAILDPAGGGAFKLAPAGPYEAERRYRPETNVLETTFRTSGGTVLVTDALNRDVDGPLAWTELAREVRCGDGEVPMCWRVAPGDRFGRARPWAVADGWPAPVPHPDRVRQRLRATESSWQRWSQTVAYQGPDRELVVRSALVLKLLTYAPLDALIRLGLQHDAHGTLSWLLRAVSGTAPEIRPFYGLRGDVPAEGGELPVRGYRDSRPAHDGNKAVSQSQWGMSCWVALDRAVRLAEDGQLPTGNAGRWRAEAAAVRDWIEANCWSAARQSYTFYAGTEELDAAVLLAARAGYLPADEPRFGQTIDAICGELADGALVYRYTGSRRQEGAFLACSFWLADALALAGRAGEARRVFLDAAARCSDLGLLSEEIDPASGELLGNMPQALSHLALLTAACQLADVNAAAPGESA
jgi:GH15 family glucan-1,4-alpha-glucosidase